MQASRRFSVPTKSTAHPVNTPPKIAPAIPPVPMNPKTRRASRVVNTALDSNQIREVVSTPYRATHTKKT